MKEENAGNNNGGTMEYPNFLGGGIKFLKIGFTVMVIAIVCVIAVSLYNENEKNQQIGELRTILMTNNWERPEMTDSGSSTYYLKLDFSNNMVDCKFDSVFISEELSTYSYEILDGETILFTSDYGNDQEITVTFNEDQTMMTFNPALISSDFVENWYVEDYWEDYWSTEEDSSSR